MATAKCIPARPRAANQTDDVPTPRPTPAEVFRADDRELSVRMEAAEDHRRRRGPAARFVPVDVVPVTVFLPASDLHAIEAAANTTDVVGVVTAIIRQQLLQQPATGPEASRLGRTESITLHIPQAIRRRLPDEPGAVAGLVSELLAAWLAGEAVSA